MHPETIIHPLAALALAPLLLGVVNRVKAWFAGRKGKPLLQLYFDIAKQLRKGTVYSDTSSWVVRAGPIVGLACPLIALLFLPTGAVPSVVSFAWDLVVVAYLLGLARLFTVLSALDTGSAFEGMGSSREVLLGAMAEPVVILVLGALARVLLSDGSISDTFAKVSPSAWATNAPTLALVASALFIVFLAENCRVPFDDPNTHLELTMIHEVMVLDHGGPDFAFILYGASLKMWIFAALVVNILVPIRTGVAALDAAIIVVGVLLVGALTGVIESTMARLRLVRLPQLLVAAGVLSVLAFVLQSR